MRVTENLKKAVRCAIKDGYKNIAVVCSNHKATTYYHYVSFEDILNSKNGTELSNGRFNGSTWKNIPANTFNGYHCFMKKYL